jgi:hypothetical protein
MHTDGLVAHYELDGNFSDISGHYITGTSSPAIRGSIHGRVGKAGVLRRRHRVSFGNAPRSIEAIPSRLRSG